MASDSMNHLRKTVAALGFVCFFSLALLPVSMTLCGPLTSRLNHHAKRLHRESYRISYGSTVRLEFAQPLTASFGRDILAEGDSVRSMLEHTGIGRSPSGPEPDGPEISQSRGLIHSARASGFDFHTVLLL